MSNQTTIRSSGPSGTLRRPCAAVLLAAALLAPSIVAAQYSPQDLAVSPPYCPYTVGYQHRMNEPVNPAILEQWRRKFGHGSFVHLHHYCWGLLAFHNAKFKVREPEAKKRLFRYSITEFNYVAARVAPDFVLLPEVLNNRATAYIQLGEPQNAIPDLQRAISLRPDWWPASVTLSDLYRDAGKIQLARDVLENALSASPDSKSLKARLAELGSADGKAKPDPTTSKQPRPGGSPRASAGAGEKEPKSEPAAETTDPAPKP